MRKALTGPRLTRIIILAAFIVLILTISIRSRRAPTPPEWSVSTGGLRARLYAHPQAPRADEYMEVGIAFENVSSSTQDLGASLSFDLTIRGWWHQRRVSGNLQVPTGTSVAPQETCWLQIDSLCGPAPDAKRSIVGNAYGLRMQELSINPR